MKCLPLVFMGMFLFGCGGDGDDGPSGPRPPANVQGSWSATSTVHTVTEGPLCVVTQVPRPLEATITQNGPNIALNIAFTGNFACSFSGTVSDTSINWTLDQQQSHASCLFNSLACVDPDGLVRRVFNSDIRSSSFNGSVSGDQISVAGETASVVGLGGTPFLPLRVATSIVLQRRR